MFTGLVETLGTVQRIASEGDGKLLTISVKFAGQLSLGESVAVNGACLTVMRRDEGTCSFQAGPESLRRTNLGELSVNDRVNLERAIRAGDRLGGHWVQGHVDGLGQLLRRELNGGWQMVWFSCPPALARQMVPKGSATVDGVSLTLVDVKLDCFSVALIPHTLNATTLGIKKPGQNVNLETDILAKYVWKCLDGSGLTLEKLRQAGLE